MRRVLAVLGLLILGLVVGFLVRLLWPQRGLSLDSYGPHATDGTDGPI
jgi:uncharacterized membrane protein SpoIIM required for sporulation